MCMKSIISRIAGALVSLFDSCRSSQSGGGIGDADSIQVDYTGTTGTKRYIIDYSDTITLLPCVFVNDAGEIEVMSPFLSLAMRSPSDIVEIKQLACRLFVEGNGPDILWTRPCECEGNDVKTMSVHVFRKKQKTTFNCFKGYELEGIVYSNGQQIKFADDFLEFMFRLENVFAETENETE